MVVQKKMTPEVGRFINLNRVIGWPIATIFMTSPREHVVPGARVAAEPESRVIAPQPQRGRWESARAISGGVH